MATIHQYLCDVCMSQHITQTAIICCPECEENFCEKCKVHHEFAKATKKHEVIPIENVLKLPKFVQDIKLTCPDHEERFFVYCDDHGVPCCAHCLQNVHAGCRNLIPIQKLIQNVKESSLLIDLETTLSDLITNITNIIEDRTANLQDLDEQKTRCKKEIKAHKEAIYAYVEELETDLLDNLQKTFIEREVKIQNTLKDFELRKSNVCKMQENVTIVQDIASEFQFFMAIRELTKSANFAEADLQQLFKGGSFKWVEMFYTPTKLNSVKHKLFSIGKTDVRVHPSNIELKVGKNREAQRIGQRKSSISFESIQLKEKFNGELTKINLEIGILDCGFLPNGNLVFLDRENNRIIVLDSNCVFVRNIILSFCPIRFAIIDEENIAITTEYQVNIVELKRGSVLKILIPGTRTRSIALTDNKDLIVEIIGAGYTRIDLQGNIKKKIHIAFSSSYYHFPVCIKEKLYFVDTPNAVLYCYDFDGNQVSKFEDQLFKAHIALTSDKLNTFFCSSWNSNNVFVVSTEVKSSKEIIKSNLYLNNAVAADYNIRNRELLIVTKNGNFVLYDVI